MTLPGGARASAGVGSEAADGIAGEIVGTDEDHFAAAGTFNHGGCRHPGSGIISQNGVARVGDGQADALDFFQAICIERGGSGIPPVANEERMRR